MKMTDPIDRSAKAAMEAWAETFAADGSWVPPKWGDDAATDEQWRMIARAAIGTSTLQLLHDLEIAGSITWTFDGDWHVDIGSPVQAEANVSSEREAMDWLRAKALEIYRAPL